MRDQVTAKAETGLNQTSILEGAKVLAKKLCTTAYIYVHIII